MKEKSWASRSGVKKIGVCGGMFGVETAEVLALSAIASEVGRLQGAKAPRCGGGDRGERMARSQARRKMCALRKGLRKVWRNGG